MARAEWGMKRRCLSCGAAFYDLGKSPILCPKCGTEFNPEVLVKTRRPAKPEEVKPVKPAKVPVDAVIEADEEDADLGDDILEDADEFEDEDVVAEEIDVEAEPDTEER